MSGKQKNFRKKKAIASDEEGSHELDKDALQDIKLMQRERGRKKGLTAEELIVGAPLGSDEEGPKYGLQKRKAADADEKDMTQLESTFTTQQDTAEVDEHMEKFIQEEMARRRGEGGEKKKEEEKPKSREDELYTIPAHLKAKSKIVEDTAGAWLTGIMEVQLPIDYKLKNIEETEAAKRRMIEERKARMASSTGISTGVVNYNAAYSQHAALRRAEVRAPGAEGAEEERGRKRAAASSDDAALRRFKAYAASKKR
eukprot:tig00001424_g8711.t1